MNHSTATSTERRDQLRTEGAQQQPVVSAKATRRQFISNCSTLAVAASIAPTVLARPLHGREVPLEQITPEDFGRLLNTAFVARTQRGPAKLVLVDVQIPDVTPQSLSAEDGRNEKFTLRFSGAPLSALSQDTYLFEHQRIGKFSMFIVPIGCADERRCFYEAVFNRPPTVRSRASQPQFR